MNARTPLFRPIAVLLLAAAVITAVDNGAPSTAEARVVRRAPRSEPLAEPSTPLLAVVGLAEQRITIYDATGKILQSPVSSGQSGLETPAGIFSVVQKNEEHHSNIYDDASMPFMERITWTGIALHAGELPGYPASHGCVRMPHDFARELFGLTKLGLRVVVAREDIAPVDIAAPAFFKPKHQIGVIEAAATADVRSAAERRRRLTMHLHDNARTRETAADAAIAREKDARQAAARASADGASALRALKQAEASVAKAEADLKAAEKALETGGPAAKLEKAERVKAQATVGVETTRAALQKMQAQSQVKVDAVTRAEQEAQAAAAAANAAVEALAEAKQNISPVSVLISRKTQRLYVRKGNMPVYEAPILIDEHDRMMGSFVFTALDFDAAGEMRWNVISLFKSPTDIQRPAPAGKVAAGKSKAASNRTEPFPTDAGAARAALDRFSVSDEARERISEVVLPGSSLIISDEPPSIETGKDTDFVVIMSGEPQGGIAIRQRPPREREYSSARDDDRGEGPRRSRRSSGGGNGFSSWFD